jgi:two-component system sensor histidine kinase RegB
MGLGLFIAKTLLERAGATLQFENGRDTDQRSGAVVSVTWARDLVDADQISPAGALGQNEKIIA